MKKPVTPEQKPPIPDTWYLVKTPATTSGWAVAYYDAHYECWQSVWVFPIEVISYIPEPLNEIE